MILSKEFYERCCPSYKKAIDELEKNIADIGVINWKGYLETEDEASGEECFAKSKQLITTVFDFATKYLTPKEYWEYVMRFFDDIVFDTTLEDRKIVFCGLAKIAFSKHLYYKQKWNSIDDTRYDNHVPVPFLNAYEGEHFKLLEFQMKHYLRERAFPRFYQNYVVSEQDLSYPHDRLKECFLQYEKSAIRLPSDKLVKQYEKMKTLFPKIKAAENDDVEAWFKLLLQVGDDIFVMHNVECRLGHDLFNVKLWKLYLTFLKEHGKTNRLVKILSEYCRFFLEDLQMLDELKAELDKHGIINAPLDRLCIFDVKEVVEKEDTTQDEEILPFDRNLCSTFYDSTRNQRFSLPKPIIRYIVENVGHRVLRKLFSSCKYFYAKKPTPICYSLLTGSETSYNGERLTLQPTGNPELCLKKTFITGVFEVLENAHSNRAFMSRLIPRLHRCEAKYITLYFQNLTFDELKCLIQHGGVIELQIQTCKIKDKKDDFVDLEHILAYLPNIEVLSLPKVKTNKNTGNALSTFKFSGKICSFVITSIFGIPFNADEFLKFITANRDEKMFKCSMFFSVGFNPDFVQKFKKTMDDFAESCGNCIINIDFNVDD